MIVEWTDGALAHILSIRNYVASFSPGSADALADRIVRRADQIGLFPLSGRKMTSMISLRSEKFTKADTVLSITSRLTV